MTAGKPGRFNLAVVLSLEAVLVVALHLAGGATGPVPFGSLVSWLSSADPATALAAVARLAGLAIAWWLLASTLLYALSYHLGMESLTRALDWVTLPVIRRVVQGVTVASLTGISLLGPTALAASPALAQVSVVGQTSSTEPGSTPDQTGAYTPGAAGWPQAPGTSGFWLPSGPTAAAGAPAPAPATPAAPVTPAPAAPAAPARGSTSTAKAQTGGGYTVVRGDNLWVIAERQVHQAAGRAGTEDEVRHYWRKLVTANRSHLRSGDPNLIYPNEKLTLPKVFS